MFVRLLKVKKEDQEYDYLKIVESVREHGTTKQLTLLNFGNVKNWPPDKLKRFIEKLNEFFHLELLPSPRSVAVDDEVEMHAALSYGPFYAAEAMWQALDFDHLLVQRVPAEAVTIDWLRAVKVMVFNRLVAPTSKRAITRWLKRQAIPGIYPQQLPLHYYYRSLDYLIKAKTALEKDIFFQVTDLFTLELSVVFYDLSSSYFEGSACPIAKYGYSRDHRPDRRQIELALIVNRDSVPLAHEVWEGNVKDNVTVPDAIGKLQAQFHFKRVIFVGDNAMNTPNNLEQLRSAGYEYLVSIKPNYDSRVPSLLEQFTLYDKRFPEKSGFEKVKDNLYVKELERPAKGFDDDERIVLSLNPLRAQESAAKHRRKIKRAIRYLETFKRPRKQGQSKDRDEIHRLIANNLKHWRLEEYFTYMFHREGHFEYRLDKRCVIAQRKKNGVLFLLTNTPTERLSAPEIASNYRMLARLEANFRVIKDVLKIRPIRHYRESRVRGHVFVCVLALLLERLIEKKLHDAQLELTAPAVFEKLSSLQLVQYRLFNKELYKTTKPEKEHLEIFRALGAPRFNRVPHFAGLMPENAGVV